MRECLVELAGLCVLARLALMLVFGSSNRLSAEALSALLRFSRRWGAGGDSVDAGEDAPSSLGISRLGVSVGGSSLAFLRGEEGLVVDFRLDIFSLGKETKVARSKLCCFAAIEYERRCHPLP